MWLWNAQRKIINIKKKHFLPVSGNEYIHMLTNQGPCELRVDMSDFDGDHRFAHYKVVHVASRDTKYRLTVGGYSGNAGK